MLGGIEKPEDGVARGEGCHLKENGGKEEEQDFEELCLLDECGPEAKDDVPGLEENSDEQEEFFESES